MKKFALLLVSIVSVFCITGCEKKNTGGSTGGSQASGPITFQLWTTEGKSFFDALGKEFALQTGGGLNFKVVEFGSQLEMESFLLDQLAEGKGPDLIYTTGDFIALNHGKILPAPGAEPVVDQATFESKFVQATQDVFLGEDGAVYGVPMGVDSLALVYNQAHIADRLPSSNTPSEYWQDFKTDVENLTQEDNSFERFAVSGAALGRLDNITYGADILENMMLQLGVNFFDTTGVQSLFHITEAPIDGRTQNLGEEALDFFTSFADSRFKHYSWNEFLTSASNPNKDFEAFARGKTSMIFAKSQDIQTIKDVAASLREKRQGAIAENDIRVTFLPQAVDPTLNPNRKVVGYVTGLVVGKNTPYPNTAWDFLVFAAGKENLMSWHEATKLPTPRVDLILEQEKQPHLGIYARQAKYARSNLLPLQKSIFQAGLATVVGQLNQRLIKTEGALDGLGRNMTMLLKNRLARQQEIAQ